MPMFDLKQPDVPTESFLDLSGKWHSRDGSLYQSTAALPSDVSSIQKKPTEVAFMVAKKVYEQYERNQKVAESITVPKIALSEEDIGERTSLAVDPFGGVAGDMGAAKKGLDAIKKTRGFVESVTEEFPILRVAGQYIPRRTDRLAIKARNLVKDNIELAEKKALGTDDEAVATASELIKYYVDEADNFVSEATRKILYDEAARVAHGTAVRLTELGRSVQAASILSRLTPEGQVRFAAREIARYNEAIDTSRFGFGLAKKLPNITGEQTRYIVQEMKSIQGMDEGIAKAMRFNNLQNYIKNFIPSSFLQKASSVWKAGLLTGIKTSGLNIFSNLSHSVAESVKNVPAVAVDKMVSLFTKQRTVALTFRGQGSGVKEGVEKGWRYLKTGFDERDMATKLDYRRVNFGTGKIARALQTYEEGVFRVIGAEDQPFYYGAKARSIAEQAVAAAKNTGLKGKELEAHIAKLIEEPTDDMVRYAVLDAETAVFQNPTLLGRVAKALQNIPGGEFVVPFGRTPSAVATQVINYSPLGVAKPIARIIKAVKTGQFDQRLFSQEAGRALTGTGIIWAGMELFDDDRVTLDFPRSEREQKLWELEGRKPNSIKVGDKWRSVQVLGPAGNLMLLGGHFKNALANSGSPTEAMIEAMSGSAKSFLEQTFLKGTQQIIEAVTDPSRSFEGYFGSLLSSFIPTIVSDVARASDPLERRQETMLERFQARLPWIREELEPQIDVFGRERERKGNVLEVMADPTRPYPIKDDPVVHELRRLHDLGFQAAPTLLGDRDGFKILSQEQNTQLWKRAGEITREKLSSLIQHPLYPEIDDEMRAKKIEEITGKAKTVARAEIVLELTQGMEGDRLLEKLRELKADGLMSQEVFNVFQQLR